MGEAPLREDPLVQKLAPDPAKAAPTALLVGFLGRGTAPGKWRVYVDCQLCEYFEVDEADVLRHHQPDPGPDNFGGTVLWVRGGATVRRVRTSSAQAQAEFLAGDLAAAHLPGAPLDVATRLPASIDIPISMRPWMTCTLVFATPVVRTRGGP